MLSPSAPSAAACAVTPVLQADHRYPANQCLPQPGQHALQATAPQTHCRRLHAARDAHHPRAAGRSAAPATAPGPRCPTARNGHRRGRTPRKSAPVPPPARRGHGPSLQCTARQPAGGPQVQPQRQLHSGRQLHLERQMPLKKRTHSATSPAPLHGQPPPVRHPVVTAAPAPARHRPAGSGGRFPADCAATGAAGAHRPVRSRVMHRPSPDHDLPCPPSRHHHRS